MSTLFGFYGLGLSSLQAAQTGLLVTGDNIANANTPGYARRRVDLVSGIPIPIRGGQISNGVRIQNIRRQEDSLLQFNLEREKGTQAGSLELLRGLRQIEESYGSIQSDDLSSSLASFSEAFSALSAQPENASLRRGALSEAQTVARQLNSKFQRFTTQGREEDQSLRQSVVETNRLAEDLADLNRRIASSEAEGVNAPLRDQRQVVVEQLVELTGGYTVADERGRLQFQLPGGGTLVTAERVRPIQVNDRTDGNASIRVGDQDITDTLRKGVLGAQLELRDERIPEQIAKLNTIAADLTAQANAIVTGSTDLNGNAGVALFVPDPPGANAAASIGVNSALLDDPSLLGISGDGSTGDGTGAAALAALRATASAALGNRSLGQYLSDLTADLGTDISQADVSAEVSTGLVQSLQARRDAVSGVSLDEEAVNLIQYQRTYEAAARFISVLNDITELTVNLGR